MFGGAMVVMREILAASMAQGVQAWPCIRPLDLFAWRPRMRPCPAAGRCWAKTDRHPLVRGVPARILAACGRARGSPAAKEEVTLPCASVEGYVAKVSRELRVKMGWRRTPF